MTRLILLIIIAMAIYWLWKWTMGRYTRTRQNFGQNRFKNETPSGAGENMSELVQDPVCKLYIAKDKAIFYKDCYFCSEKCKNEYKGGDQ